jgi:hypothetical protein
VLRNGKKITKEGVQALSRASDRSAAVASCSISNPEPLLWEKRGYTSQIFAEENQR